MIACFTNVDLSEICQFSYALLKFQIQLKTELLTHYFDHIIVIKLDDIEDFLVFELSLDWPFISQLPGVVYNTAVVLFCVLLVYLINVLIK